MHNLGRVLYASRFSVFNVSKAEDAEALGCSLRAAFEALSMKLEAIQKALEVKHCKLTSMENRLDTLQKLIDSRFSKMEAQLDSKLSAFRLDRLVDHLKQFANVMEHMEVSQIKEACFQHSINQAWSSYAQSGFPATDEPKTPTALHEHPRNFLPSCSCDLPCFVFGHSTATQTSDVLTNAGQSSHADHDPAGDCCSLAHDACLFAGDPSVDYVGQTVHSTSKAISKEQIDFRKHITDKAFKDHAISKEPIPKGHVFSKKHKRTEQAASMAQAVDEQNCIEQEVRSKDEGISKERMVFAEQDRISKQYVALKEQAVSMEQVASKRAEKKTKKSSTDDEFSMQHGCNIDAPNLQTKTTLAAKPITNDLFFHDLPCTRSASTDTNAHDGCTSIDQYLDQSQKRFSKVEVSGVMEALADRLRQDFILIDTQRNEDFEARFLRLNNDWADKFEQFAQATTNMERHSFDAEPFRRKSPQDHNISL